jgi:hypothetical protein
MKNYLLESGLSIPLRCYMIFTSKFNKKFDLSEVEKANLSNEIRKFKIIDTFLDHINQKNICIFFPNECFITVFHSLLGVHCSISASFGEITFLSLSTFYDSSSTHLYQVGLVALERVV